MELRYYHYFQLASFLVAILCYKGLVRYRLTAFFPLLAVVCTIELLATNSELFGWKSNYFLYNYYLLVSLPLHFYIFYKILGLVGTTKYVFLTIALLGVTLSLLNYFSYQGKSVFNSNTLLFFEIINIFFSCILLIQMSLEDNSRVPLLKHPYFWVAAPTLLFSLGTMVVLGLQQYISSNNIHIDGKSLYRVIVPALNVLLYAGYAYAFILCRTTHRQLPLPLPQ